MLNAVKMLFAPRVLGSLVWVAMLACVNADPAPLPGGNAVRLLPLGDSITQGGQGFASYRYPLWFLLRDAGFQVDFAGTRTVVFGGDGGNNPNLQLYPRYYTDFDRDHEGRWGWRTDEILGVIDSVVAGAPPEVVLLHLGSNDLGQRGAAGVDAATNNLARIIARLRVARANVAVLLAQIIPIGPGTSYSPNAGQVPVLNQRLARLAVLLDTPESRVLIVDQFAGYNLAAMMQSDGLHPNVLGEATMATNWFKTLAPVLRGEVPPRAPARLDVRRQAGQVVLTWPVAAGPFSLETAASLPAAEGWTKLTNGLAQDGANWSLTNRVDDPRRFFRLSLE